jgi:hypothetical protein
MAMGLEYLGILEVEEVDCTLCSRTETNRLEDRRLALSCPMGDPRPHIGQLRPFHDRRPTIGYDRKESEDIMKQLVIRKGYLINEKEEGETGPASSGDSESSQATWLPSSVKRYSTTGIYRSAPLSTYDVCVPIAARVSCREPV